jgi:hypothetical protein
LDDPAELVQCNCLIPVLIEVLTSTLYLPIRGAPAAAWLATPARSISRGLGRVRGREEADPALRGSA